MKIKECISNDKKVDGGEALDASLYSMSRANNSNDEEALDARLVYKACADDNNEVVSNTDSVIVGHSYDTNILTKTSYMDLNRGDEEYDYVDYE
ncbi:hypothetical protein Tco_0233835 [Tanacetum coccineum]